MNTERIILLAVGTFAALGYASALGVMPRRPFGALAAVVMVACGCALLLPLIGAEIGEMPCRTGLDDYVDLGEAEDR
jgi:hypothetical protein